MASGTKSIHCFWVIMAITGQSGDIPGYCQSMHFFRRLPQLKPLKLESHCLQTAICGLDTGKSAMPKSLIVQLNQLSTNEADQAVDGHPIYTRKLGRNQ